MVAAPSRNKHSHVPARTLEGCPNHCDRTGLWRKTAGEGTASFPLYCPPAPLELSHHVQALPRNPIGAVEITQEPVCQPWVCRLHTVAWVRPRDYSCHWSPGSQPHGGRRGIGNRAHCLLCQATCYMLSSHSCDFFSTYDVPPLCHLGAQWGGDSRTPHWCLSGHRGL